MRYFLECTHTHKSQLRTGIQRVVRNLVRHSRARAQVTPVIVQGDRFVALEGEDPLAPIPQPAGARALILRAARGAYAGVRAFASALLPFPSARRFLNAPRHEFGLSFLITRAAAACLPAARQAMAPPEGVKPGPGDVLLLVDSSWHDHPWAAARAFKAHGGLIVCMIHDLIPETHPEYCDDRLRALFADWITQAFELADGFVCNSQTTADAVHARLVAAGKAQKATHFWLGSEIAGDTTLQESSPPLTALDTEDPVFACVGTLEPRKNQTYALDAFDMAWAQGVRARLLLVGRLGWMSEPVVARIRRHERYGRDLFLLTDADDTTLSRIYQRANALVFPSHVEGFGLPLVEALQQGAPVIASDIPVFREIARTGVDFVRLDDPADCARAVIAHCANGAPRLEHPIEWLSWAQSTDQFYGAVSDCLAKT
jgi:glycosyltransferase involved in cell wall biosynthesis